MVPPASLRLLAVRFAQTGRFARPSLLVVASCAPCPVTIEFQTFREANLRYTCHHVSDAGFTRQRNRPVADAAGIEGAVADDRRRQRHRGAQPRKRHPHSFLGIDQDGVTSIVRTAGNPNAHIVLRGGRAQTNYDAESFWVAEEKLKSENLPPVLMVDCSHANSEKQHARQEDAWRSVIQQRVDGTRSLIGLMVESDIHEGNQPIPKKTADLRYGVSITDSCIGWETTGRMLRWGHEMLANLPKIATVA
jgi:hypothetical protein